MQKSDDRFLRIYLNDHLATLTAGIELAKRSGSNNRTTPLGEFLRELLSGFEGDREALLGVLGGLGLTADPVKRSAGWLAEKAGRLKFNGRLFGYSDLSRLIELEGLAVIASGNAALWRSLATVSLNRPAPTAFDFGEMAQRAEGQRARIESFRSEAAATAFAAK